VGSSTHGTKFCWQYLCKSSFSKPRNGRSATMDCSCGAWSAHRCDNAVFVRMHARPIGPLEKRCLCRKVSAWSPAHPQAGLLLALISRGSKKWRARFAHMEITFLDHNTRIFRINDMTINSRFPKKTSPRASHDSYSSVACTQIRRENSGAESPCLCCMGCL
jgi:hypothetical protein